MNDNEDKEQVVHVINKRNQAVFAVPLKDARELLDNFSELVETSDELPEEPKPETPVDPDEQKILGADEDKTEPEIEPMSELETPDELPEEPKPETPVKTTETVSNQPKARKTEIIQK